MSNNSLSGIIRLNFNGAKKKKFQSLLVICTSNQSIVVVVCIINSCTIIGMIKKLKKLLNEFRDEDYEDEDDLLEEKVELINRMERASELGAAAVSYANSTDTMNPVHLSAYTKMFSRDLPRLVSRKTNHYRVKRKNQHILRSSLLNLTSTYHLLISWS